MSGVPSNKGIEGGQADRPTFNARQFLGDLPKLIKAVQDAVKMRPDDEKSIAEDACDAIIKGLRKILTSKEKTGRVQNRISARNEYKSEMPGYIVTLDISKGKWLTIDIRTTPRPTNYEGTQSHANYLKYGSNLENAADLNTRQGELSMSIRILNDQSQLVTVEFIAAQGLNNNFGLIKITGVGKTISVPVQRDQIEDLLISIFNSAEKNFRDMTSKQGDWRP